MKNNIWTYIRLAFYLFVVISVTICAVNEIYLKCYFVENLGITCPTCGATRATLSIIKGNIISAVEYNAFYSLIILPAFIIFMVEDLYIIIKRSILKTSDISLIEVLFGGKV